MSSSSPLARRATCAGTDPGVPCGTKPDERNTIAALNQEAVPNHVICGSRPPTSRIIGCIQKMPEDRPSASFSQGVEQQLSPDIRELWTPMADYFERDGPEAVRTYLDAERDRLEGNVRGLLERLKEG